MIWTVSATTRIPDLTGVAVADAVAGSREAHRPPPVNLAQDLVSGRRWCRSCGLGAPVHPHVIFGQVPAGVGGDQDAVVADLEQAVDGLHGNALAGQLAADVVAVLEDADPSRSVNTARDRVAARSWLVFGGLSRIDDLDRHRSGRPFRMTTSISRPHPPHGPHRSGPGGGSFTPAPRRYGCRTSLTM